MGLNFQSPLWLQASLPVWASEHNGSLAANMVSTIIPLRYHIPIKCDAGQRLEGSNIVAKGGHP